MILTYSVRSFSSGGSPEGAAVALGAVELDGVALGFTGGSFRGFWGARPLAAASSAASGASGSTARPSTDSAGVVSCFAPAGESTMAIVPRTKSGSKIAIKIQASRSALLLSTAASSRALAASHCARGSLRRCRACSAALHSASACRRPQVDLLCPSPPQIEQAIALLLLPSDHDPVLKEHADAVPVRALVLVLEGVLALRLQDLLVYVRWFASRLDEHLPRLTDPDLSAQDAPTFCSAVARGDLLDPSALLRFPRSCARLEFGCCWRSPETA
jgi:hypothetical protein